MTTLRHIEKIMPFSCDFIRRHTDTEENADRIIQSLDEVNRVSQIAEDEMRSLVSALYDEFCETQLATEEQWNEAIAPKLTRLANVLRGNAPDEVTARVYKFPKHLSPNTK